MRVAIIQSSYIPWKGYFDLIHSVDRFAFYDDVQFTTRDWRTRNRIKTPHGPQWLSIPVGNRRDRLICDVALEDSQWQRQHWMGIYHNYCKAPYFKVYEELFKDIYLSSRWRSLSEFNQHMAKVIATDILGVRTEFRDSREFRAEGKRQDRIISLLCQMGATHYVSGPSARSYLDAAAFSEAGIALSYHDYSGYPAYPQLHPPFEHAVSVLDLLFHVGPEACHHIWGWRGQ